MPGSFLTTASEVKCMHGGQVTLSTANSTVLADGAPILLETDNTHSVAGCPFTVGQKYSPCVRVEWTQGARATDINGTPGLVKTSIGKCINAEGAPQGVATVVNAQVKADSQ